MSFLNTPINKKPIFFSEVVIRKKRPFPVRESTPEAEGLSNLKFTV
jgi:hypothetical protein